MASRYGRAHKTVTCRTLNRFPLASVVVDLVPQLTEVIAVWVVDASVSVQWNMQLFFSLLFPMPIRVTLFLACHLPALA